MTRFSQLIAWDRQKVQAKLIEAHGKKAINAKQLELCGKCLQRKPDAEYQQDYLVSVCNFYLLPITVAGDKCPYFEETPQQQ